MARTPKKPARPAPKKSAVSAAAKPKATGKKNALTKAKEAGFLPKHVKGFKPEEEKPNPRGIYATAEDHEEDLPAKAGRPSMFTPELGVRICRLLADGTPALAIWLMDSMPTERTFFRWMAKEGPQFELFRQEVARAREQRATARTFNIERYLVQLTDPNLSARAGLKRLDPQEAKVAMEGERILQACEDSKKYGKSLTLKGDPAAPLETRTRHELSEEELEAIARGGLAGSDA